MNFPMVIEAIEKLGSIATNITNDNYRVTEDQWAEMTKQLLIIEQTLADTNDLLHKYFDAVDASMIGFYQ